jgi:hypothetical protein
MKTYLITYDLLFADNSHYYNKFFIRIKTFSLWARPTKSAWLIKTDNAKQDIYQYLKETLYFSDKLLIIQVTDDWISYNLSSEVVTWMQGGLQSS